MLMIPFPRPLLRQLPLIAFGLITLSMALRGQPQTPSSTPAPEAPSVTGQYVDSRRGYIVRVPADTRLDSTTSGWDAGRLCEVRSYVLPDVGLIRLTATVKPMQIPSDTINAGAYTYTHADSATERGTAKIRTYYLPTRSVKIEIIPFSLKGHRYTDASDKIFGAFRWKPGATSDATEVD